MNRYYLLNPGDVHMEGDEIYNPTYREWEPLNRMHFGDQVGDSNPCRRELTRHQLLKLSVEANLERVTAMV
jgi:hypothetical protein